MFEVGTQCVVPKEDAFQKQPSLFTRKSWCVKYINPPLFQSVYMGEVLCGLAIIITEYQRSILHFLPKKTRYRGVIESQRGVILSTINMHLIILIVDKPPAAVYWNLLVKMLCSVVLVIKALGHRTWHEVCICVQYFCIYYIYGLILILMRGRYKKEINTHTRQSLLLPFYYWIYGMGL